MTIIKKSNDLTMKDIYDLTKSPEIQKMTSIKGETLDIDSYAVYEDVTNTGEIQTIASIKTKEGETFATNSRTFTREFLSILDMCEEVGETVHEVKVHAATSKSGREFITCVYVS